ncbi:MAG: hypothetical protein K6A30_08475 [Lachnospiraceae bacterium]|nr:hypothetical protein [Lachnospiraceae bacterium]
MFTLKNKNLKNALQMFAFALGIALFGGIYEIFSHEVYSYFMIYAFLVPFTLGGMVFLILAAKEKEALSKWFYNFWNSGIITITFGMVMKGVLEIYGTTNAKLYLYFVLGSLLLLLGIMAALPKVERKREDELLYDSNR